MTNATTLTLIALLTGGLVPLQLALNGQLGTALRSPYLGALGVFVVGTLAVVGLLIVLRTPMPTMGDLRAVPMAAWIGGVIATAYIVAVVFLVPRLGVGSTAVLIIAGQVVAAMILDQIGAFGAMQSPITLTKAVGALVVIAGAALVRLG